MIDRDQFRMTLLAHSAQRAGGHWIGKGSSIDVRLALRPSLGKVDALLRKRIVNLRIADGSPA